MKTLFSFAERLAGPFLRLSLGLVLLWIGCIHLVTPQPVVRLLSLSLPLLAESAFVSVLGALEVIVGILLIAGLWVRYAALLSLVLFAGTLTIFVIAPGGDRLALAHPDGAVLAEGCGAGFRCHHGDGKGCGQP
jgi:uncharacterized membrane protein YkgB